MSLLFPGRNLKTFRRFLDPHFSPTEVYVVSVNLATDLVPRSRFDGSMTKKGEGGGRGGNEIWQNSIAWARIWPTRQLRILEV